MRMQQEVQIKEVRMQQEGDDVEYKEKVHEKMQKESAISFLG